MIYANYAATTPTLSPAVVKELCEYVEGTHINSARNFEGLETGAIALRARKAIAKLFRTLDPLKVVFTSGATQSLNMAINGLIRPGDHVIATSLEHNATARRLESLRKSGAINFTWLQCDPDGSLDVEAFRKAVRKNTRVLIMPHASNVLGTILPVVECFKIAREYGVFSILDAAQTGGIFPFTTENIGENIADVIAFTGHKGLGGLAGIGGLVLGTEVSREMRPWLAGGTGSVSHSLEMPEFLPDKFEPGTQNAIGILSLAASVEELLRIGLEPIRSHERVLTARFIEGLRELKKITPYGTLDPNRCVSLVSLVIEGYDCARAAKWLFDKHGIITRSGLHCAPLAHKTAGTYPGGTVRFSFGRGTTEAEIDAILEALSEM
jgi:cysteine desulfurase family protein